jgi:hypothetical protein
MTNLLTAVLIALLCLIAVFLTEPPELASKQPGAAQVWPTS